MSGTSAPDQAMAAARGRLAALQAARSGLVLGVADGVQQIRYPDGSGVTFGTIPERLGSVEALDREIAQAQEAILRLAGARPRRPIRQVRILTDKGI
jgi:hypothetical protein